MDPGVAARGLIRGNRYGLSGSRPRTAVAIQFGCGIRPFQQREPAFARARAATRFGIRFVTRPMVFPWHFSDDPA
jgi:hypothetical protein